MHLLIAGVFCYIESMDIFIAHACEQALRFSSVNKWTDLSEERKVQLGFNMGVIAHGLELPKEDGFGILTKLQEGTVSNEEFRNHIRSLIQSHDIKVNEENILRPF